MEDFYTHWAKSPSNFAILELMKDGKPVFDKLQELDESGMDPAGKEGQELAKQWWSMWVRIAKSFRLM